MHTIKELSLLPSRLLFVLSIASCFLIILFGASLFKYSILVLSCIAIICTYKEIKLDTALPELKEIVLPWLPWILCTVILMFIHGTKGLSKFSNAFLILCLLFIVFDSLEIKRKSLIFGLSIGLFLLDTAVFIFLSEYGLGTNILGTNRNPLFAVITIINATIISAILLDRRTYSKTEFLIILLIALYTIVMTVLAQTRHVLLAYPACACVFLLFSPKKEKKIAIYFFLIFVLMIVAFLLTGRLQQGIANLVDYSHGETNTSWGLRLEMWKMAILTFPQAPIFGWGDNAAQAMENAGVVPPLKGWFMSHFHNDLLISLTTGGVIMAGGWISTIICLIKNSLKDLPRLCLLASILAIGLADQDWFEQNVYFPFVILWTLLYITDPARKE